MKVRLFLIAVITVAFAALASTAGTAAADPISPDHVITCSAFANQPSKLGSTIDAEGAVQCSAPPDVIGIRTCLQRYYSGGWHNDICEPASGYQYGSGDSVSNFALGLCLSGTYYYRTYVYGYAFHGNAIYPTDASTSVQFAC